MSSEWKQVQVSDLEKECILLVQDGNHGEYRPRPNEFGVGDTVYIRAADMIGSRVSFDTAGRINDDAVDRIRKGKAKGGDVIFSHKGTVGKIALTPMDSPSFVCSPQTTFWRTLDSERLDRRYLYYFMRSPAFTNQWTVRKGETDMADYVSLTAQRNLFVVVPPIEIQRTIGSILGVLDDKIELNHRMNHTLEATAQAIFTSSFVDFDPVSAKAEDRQPYGMNGGTASLMPGHFVASELGPIPEGWIISSIADLARYVNGKNFTKNATGSGRMVIRIAELKSGAGASTVYNDVEANEDNTAHSGDLLFSWSGSLDVYRWYQDESVINQHIFKVIPQGFPQWFVYFQLREAISFFQGIAADKATTLGHIKREHLSQAKFALPTPELVTAMDYTIDPLYQRIHKNERESITLADIRDTLLPKLLSAEVRVGQAEQLAAKIA